MGDRMDEKAQPDVTHTAEQALLGALILTPTLINQIHTTSADFANPMHATIFTTLQQLAPLGGVDEVTVAHALAQQGLLKKLPGGAAYLHTCIATGTPGHWTDYQRIVSDAAADRAIGETAALLHHARQVHGDARARYLDLANTAIHHAITGTRAALNGRHPHLQTAKDFKMLAVKWLWQQRIPIGEITLISGREGVGKSIFLAWMAAAITNGNLPGLYRGQPRAVLYAAAEDSWHYTIAPRMLAAGANLDLVYRIDIEEANGTLNPVNLPIDLHHLGAAAAQVDAAALMLDPLLSVFDSTVNVFKGPEVREVLEPLRAMAEQHRLAILGLAHYNKGKYADSNSMIANARAFVEVSRAVLAIARDDDADDYTCVVTQTKNNLGMLEQPSLTYTIDSVTLETEDGEDTQIGRLRWTGEAEITADQLLTGTAGTRELSDTAQTIIEWVTQRGTPVTVSEVVEQFKTTIKYETVKKSLARLARSGHLETPSRGTYQAPGKPTKPHRNPPKKRDNPAPPLYPPVPVPSVPNPIDPSIYTLIERERERDRGTKRG